jgi:hypothetical protein
VGVLGERREKMGREKRENGKREKRREKIMYDV